MIKNESCSCNPLGITELCQYINDGIQTTYDSNLIWNQRDSSWTNTIPDQYLTQTVPVNGYDYYNYGNGIDINADTLSEIFKKAIEEMVNEDFLKEKKPENQKIEKYHIKHK